MIHDARVIPLDGRPHVGQNIRQWFGDSRGRWEGATLVVDTTNFTDKVSYRGATEGLRLIERFTRTDVGTVRYEFTIDDPATFTKKWTAAIPMAKTEDQISSTRPRGNTGWSTFSAARAAEKGARRKTSKNAVHIQQERGHDGARHLADPRWPEFVDRASAATTGDGPAGPRAGF